MELILFSLPLVSFAFVYMIWREKFQCQFDWLLIHLIAASYPIILFHIWVWNWVGYDYQQLYVWIAFITSAVSVGLTYRKIKGLPIFIFAWKKQLGTMLIFLALIWGMISIWQTRYPDQEQTILNIAPILKQGHYAIGQGGTSPITNAHYQVFSQKFALDIIKLNDLQRRANGITPKELTIEIIQVSVVVR
jgi:hypothetical protein